MSNLLNLLDLLDAQPGAADLRASSYQLLGEVAGRRVLDVGCGGGRAVAELSALGASAVGLDLDPAMVDAARRRWPAEEFLVGAVESLPFEDATLAGYRADKVLHAVAEPARAVAEARRVLAPGGRIVLLGQDWHTIVIDSDQPARTAELILARAATIATPTAARQYRTLLLDAGFHDPTVAVHTTVLTGEPGLTVLHGFAEPDSDWFAEQRERAATDRLFVAVPMFLVGARR